MAIQMRRGNLADFDPSKQLSGEFGVSIDSDSTDNQRVYMAFQPGVVKRLMTEEDAAAQIADAIETATEAAETAATNAATSEENAATSATNAATSEENAATSATNAATSEGNAEDSAEDAEAWAVGQRNGVDVPSTDETYHNNSKYWSEQAASSSLSGLNDVTLDTRANNQILRYDSTAEKWVNIGTVGSAQVPVYVNNGVLTQISVDSAPTSDSSNLVESGGVYDALSGKADTSALTDGSVTKVGTATVGSAAQPVYINGGVPTAIDGVPLPKSMPETTNLNDAPVGWAVFGTNATNNPFTFGGTALTMYAVSTNYWQQIAFPWASGTKRLAYRVKDGGTWGAWGLVGAGITTGTPTDINSYLTATRTEVQKSGNVVHVNLKFTILSGWSNTPSTLICKLPWSPTTTYPWLSRMAGPSTDESDHYMSSSYIDTAGYIFLGEGPYTGLTAGNSIWIYGTYLTND